MGKTWWCVYGRIDARDIGMMVRVLVGIWWCMCMLAHIHPYVDIRAHAYVGRCICTCWYMYLLVYAGTCICWYVYVYMSVSVCRYMWRNRRLWQINKIHGAMYHKLVALMQTLWELYPWHIDLGIEEWKNRGMYCCILLTAYYSLSLTWKNIWNLIGWEEYKNGRICALYLIPALPD